MEAGLGDGSKLFVDASLLEADASNNSVIDRERLKKELQESYPRLEERLDDIAGQKTTPANSRYLSTTDPDASVTRQSVGQSKLRYKTHRGVDPQHEVITTTMVSPGSTDEGPILQQMVEMHKQNTGQEVETAVADSRYGTIENFLLCHDSGIRAHIPSLKESQRGSGRQEDIFPKEAFTYHPDTDCFICPAGKELRRRHFYKDRKHYEYKAASGVCARCRLRAKCTRSQYGRTLKRHERQDDLDLILGESKSLEAQRDIKTRQHLSERSFARSVRYGYKRARWRRLWRVQIQDFLIAAIQNIVVLIKHSMNTLSKNNHPIAKVEEHFYSLLTKARLVLNSYFVSLNSIVLFFTKWFGQQPEYE